MTEGLEPSTDAETFIEFDSRIAQKGIVPAMYRELRKKVGDLGPKDTTANRPATRWRLPRDSSMPAVPPQNRWAKISNWRRSDKAAVATTSAPPKVEPVVAAVAAPAATGAPVYDLRGVACPMNYVKTKLKLEMMDAGEKLEVWLDAGEPIKNVPMSFKNDGHKVLHARGAGTGSGALSDSGRKGRRRRGNRIDNDREWPV